MTRRPRVYLCHPITSYGTENEAVCMARIAELLPDMELVDPAGRYASDAGWLRAWSRLVPTLSCLVVFGADDGTVGVGCMKELADAWLWRIPVAMLDEGGKLRELSALRILPDDERTPGRTAVVVAGRRVTLAAIEPAEEAAS